MKAWWQHAKTWKRPVQLVMAVALLAALYWAADWRAVATAVANLDVWYLLAAWSLFVPHVVVSAWRWTQLARPAGEVSQTDAIRITLAASAYNLLLPSKLGDVTKLSVVPSAGRKRGLLWLALEKGFDVAALLILAALGIAGCGWVAVAIAVAVVGAASCALVLLARRANYKPTNTSPTPAPRLLRWLARWSPIAATSALLWTLHVLQIDLFCKAAGVFVTGEFAIWRIPLAIFAGLVPFTLWGLGTRDAALVGLFSSVAPTATMATVGLLTATRYLFPGAVGIFCVLGRKPAAEFQPGEVQATAS